MLQMSAKIELNIGVTETFDKPSSWISTESWNYNTRNNISFSVSKISFIYLMAPINFIND